MDKHRHPEFILFLGRFLGMIDADTAAELDLHVMADNYGTHNHAEVKAWWSATRASITIGSAALRPAFGIVPTSSSWVVLAEPGRALLRRVHPQAHPARRLQERHRSGGRDLPLPFPR